MMYYQKSLSGNKYTAIFLIALFLNGNWHTTYGTNENNPPNTPPFLKLLGEGNTLKLIGVGVLIITAIGYKILTGNKPTLSDKDSKLAALLKSEHKTIFHPLVIFASALFNPSNTAAHNELENKAKGIYNSSPWPLYQAHRDIESRKKQYEELIESPHKENSSEKSAPSLHQQGTQQVEKYKTTQQLLGQCPSYTSDIRAKQTFEQKQAELRSRQQKAQALKEKNTYDKEKELIKLRLKLSDLQQKYDPKLSASTYLAQEIKIIEQRIHQLEKELCN